jgi:hypothetical protein
MPNYSQKLENLFKSIGFDDYKEMLILVVPEKDTNDEKNLVVFRSSVNVLHPTDQTRCKINFVFTVVCPEDNNNYQFKNIFAYLVRKRHERAGPTVESDYWPTGKSLPTKDQIITDVLEMAKMDKVREKFKACNHTALNQINGKHSRKGRAY